MPSLRYNDAASTSHDCSTTARGRCRCGCRLDGATAEGRATPADEIHHWISRAPKISAELNHEDRCLQRLLSRCPGPRALGASARLHNPRFFRAGRARTVFGCFRRCMTGVVCAQLQAVSRSEKDRRQVTAGHKHHGGARAVAGWSTWYQLLRWSMDSLPVLQCS